MRFIQTRLGRVAAGIVVPLAVVAGLVSAPASQAVSPSPKAAQSASSMTTLASVAQSLLAPATVGAAVAAAGPYTLAQVAQHSTQSDCWTAINGSVYNLNVGNFIRDHEGGTTVLLPLCGADGSGLYNKKHAGKSDPASMLASLRIGAFDPTPPPVPSATFTITQVGAHNSATDCYTVIGTTVYKLTDFVNKHAGGALAITGLCGFDGTATFNGTHGVGGTRASASARSTLAIYAIGTLTGPSSIPTPTPNVSFTATQLATHNIPASDCYVAISGKVYDLTAWKNTSHPGGAPVIEAWCGKDGTATFTGRHGLAGTTSYTAHINASSFASTVKGTYSGGTTTPTAQGSYTLAQIAKHNLTTDCWVGLVGNVYNLTTWKVGHPGGEAIIDGVCGTDGTSKFYTKHAATSGTTLAVLSGFLVGTQSDYVAVTIPAAVTVAAVTFQGDFTMADVAKHSTASDCWSVINGGIYGLSTWIPVHPGGSSVVAAMCGGDGTAAYNGKHGSSASAGAILAKLRLGNLVGVTAKVMGQYTIEQVAAHKTAADCWSVVSGNVYDLTKWVGQHPGGSAVIEAMCGIDATTSYTAKHGTNTKAATALASFKIGTLTGASTLATPVAATSPMVKRFTFKQIHRHQYASNCWTAVNGKVYNLTPWTKKHANRKTFVKVMCGRNGTRSYNKASGGVAKSDRNLKRYKIGVIATKATAATPTAATAPAASGLYTAAQVATHATATDCWSIVSGGVYNLTTWIGQHPGGPGVIKAMCGKDGSASFNGMHSGSATAKAALDKLKVGIVG